MVTLRGNHPTGVVVARARDLCQESPRAIFRETFGSAAASTQPDIWIAIQERA
jgi:hypothetical protein